MAKSTATINPEQLHAYLDDALSEEETAQVEKALRESEKLRRQLSALMQTRDRGEHTIGAIWRRQRLSCPSRQELGSYLLQVLDRELQKYIDFHLQTVGCPFCRANLTDLQTLQQEPAPQSQQRRKRFFESSAGYLQVCRETNRDKKQRT
jgi:hypothetical protein